jgi:hypothetical protein
MKVGDLVGHYLGDEHPVGLVIEVGKYAGNADVKVLWNGTSEALTQKSMYLKVINESR